MVEITFIDQKPFQPGTSLFNRVLGEAPSPGILQLQAILEEEGHKIHIASVSSLRDVDKALKDHPNTDIVGITCFTNTSIDAYKTAVYIKEIYDLHTFIGGCHVTFMPLEAIQYTDVVFVGEAELTVKKFLNEVKKSDWPKRKRDRIIGALFDKNGIRPDPRYRVKNLDDLPFPKFLSFKEENLPFPLNKISEKVLPPRARILTSRGCPFACEFCQSSRMGGIKWRSNSAEYLTELVRTYLEKGVRLVAFMDDNFTLSAKRVTEICRNIEEKRLDFMWGCLSRPDWVAKHPDVFKRMVECGCKIIYMSAESCSDEVLKGFKKGTKVDVVKRGFDIVSEYSDVLCIGSLIIGANNDTVETMNGSIEYLKMLNPHLAQFSILTPYPGTPLYNRLLKENRINSFNWADYTCEKIVFNHPLIDNTYVQRRFYEAYSEYYSRWKWQDKIKGLELSGNILPLLPKSLKSWLFYSLIVKRAKKAILRHIADATKNFEENDIIPTTSSSLELDAFLDNLRKSDKRVYRA